MAFHESLPSDRLLALDSDDNVVAMREPTDYLGRRIDLLEIGSWACDVIEEEEDGDNIDRVIDNSSGQEIIGPSAILALKEELRR